MCFIGWQLLLSSSQPKSFIWPKRMIYGRFVRQKIYMPKDKEINKCTVSVMGQRKKAASLFFFVRFMLKLLLLLLFCTQEASKKYLIQHEFSCRSNQPDGIFDVGQTERQKEERKKNVDSKHRMAHGMNCHTGKILYKCELRAKHSVMLSSSYFFFFFLALTHFRSLPFG